MKIKPNKTNLKQLIKHKTTKTTNKRKLTKK